MRVGYQEQEAKAPWVLVCCCRWLGEQMPAFLLVLSAGEGGCRRGHVKVIAWQRARRPRPALHSFSHLSLLWLEGPGSMVP